MTHDDRASADEQRFFGRLRSGLAKTRNQLATGVGNLLLGEKEISTEALDDLETALLTTDVGVEATKSIIDELTAQVSRKQLANMDALYQALRELMVERLRGLEKPFLLGSGTPQVIFFVGVNGVGKTTTIGKLAKRLMAEGRSVMLAAGDTFRAAAVEQLQAWGQRNGVPVIAQSQGSDAASVVFDAVQAARARGVDVLLVDTAGRLQAKTQLMDELAKVRRVVERIDPQAPHEVVLVLDGGVGQNALSQVDLFHEAVGVTGLVVSKLDGTAKAGVVFAISQSASASDVPELPIYFIGVGESEDDLRPFAADQFVQALLASDTENENRF
jgi:fused signal recognition particle receptor